MGFGGFIFTFSHEALGMSPSKARGLNAAFWGSLAAGRGLAIPLATRASPQAMLLADFIGCILAMLLLCLADYVRVL